MKNKKLKVVRNLAVTSLATVAGVFGGYKLYSSMKQRQMEENNDVELDEEEAVVMPVCAECEEEETIEA